MARNVLRKLFCAAAFSAAMTGMMTEMALAQFPMPSINLEQEKHRTPEEIQHDQAIDKAYQSANKKIPDQATPNDPWATVRPAPQAAGPAKKKLQTSQAKKQQLSEGAKKPGE